MKDYAKFDDDASIRLEDIVRCTHISSCVLLDSTAAPIVLRGEVTCRIRTYPNCGTGVSTWYYHSPMGLLGANNRISGPIGFLSA